jgi:PKD repeat protein
MNYFNHIRQFTPFFFSLYNKTKIAKQVILLSFFICVVCDAMSNPLFLKDKNLRVTSTPMMRLQMKGLTNSSDETIIYYQEGATDGFDSEFDAYKIVGPTAAPHISQMYNSVLMVINGVQPVIETFSINITATTPTTGNFTITATDFAFLPKGTCVYLNDLVTGNIVNILTSPYEFNLSNSTTASRFVLSITHFQIPTIASLTQPTCQLYDGGKFKVTGTTNAPWNYMWKDSIGTIVKTLSNSYDSDSLENLVNGNYTIEITSAFNSCYFGETSFTINQIVLPAVSFISPDTVTASIMANYSTLNQSTNCENFYWDFGDGTQNSNEFEPSHNYAICGLYKTKLTGVSSSGCLDSIINFVSVIDEATKIVVELNQNIKLTDVGNNQFKITKGNFPANDISINLIDLEGKNILNQIRFSNGIEDILLDLNNFKNGIYVLSIGYKDKVAKSLKIVIK